MDAAVQINEARAALELLKVHLLAVAVFLLRFHARLVNPDRRVIENKHSTEMRSMTYLQGGCSYTGAVEEQEGEIQCGSSACCE